MDLLMRHHRVQSSKNSFFHVFSLRIAFPKHQLNKRNTKLSYSYTVYNWVYDRVENCYNYACKEGDVC